jgi:5-formyltetrahydrofolate cyclo-ligase
MKTSEVKNKVEYRRRLKSLLKINHQNRTADNIDDENLIKNLTALLTSHFNNFPEQEYLIGVFAPIQNEPNILAHINDWNHQLCFPSFQEGIENEEMVFRKSKIEGLIKKKDFGPEILCPDSACEIVVPQIILVPGLGFTEQGERLGRGRGFYDKYLNNFNGLIIGLGFELQIEKQLPTEEHDKLMNYIVTEKRLIECVEKI